MKMPLTVYYGRYPTCHEREGEFAWWWCYIGFDPEGPFDSEAEALEDVLREVKG